MDKLENEAPNVVTEAGFRQLLAKGYDAEIVCKADAYIKASVWYGEWIIRGVNSERTDERVLVTVPRSAVEAEELKFRVFRTINGLVSFMHKAGFAHVDVPLREGHRSTHRGSED